MPVTKAEIFDVGVVEYGDALRIQSAILEGVKQGRRETLILCEHPHVFTLGRHGDEGNLLSGNVPFVRTDRGGDITYHGPGQLVGYPIVNIGKRGMGTRAYVSFLEETLIELLGNHTIKGCRFNPYRGVWVKRRKIASIGVRVEGGVASHGFALNVNTDLSYFERIVPCGLPYPMTSMEKEKGTSQDFEHVKREYGELFCSRWLSL